MPRVGNKKSRSGCLRCKVRKVKCDETRPQCGWCKAHALNCEYPESKKAEHPTGNAKAPIEPRPWADSSDSDNGAGGLNKVQDQKCLELALMQYYISKVAPDFPSMNKESGLELHAEIVPQEALRNEALLNTLFAYALLHMHIRTMTGGGRPRNADFYADQGIQLEPDRQGRDSSKIELLTLHRRYLDRALKTQRTMISDINAANGDGVCLTAIWLAMISLVQSSQHANMRRYRVPREWFALQASFSTCLASARSMLTMDSATSVIIHAPPIIDGRDLDHRRYAIFRELLDWQPISQPEIIDGCTKQVYECSLAYIQTLYKRIAEGESVKALGRRILAFPSISTGKFVKLLDEGRPRALVMLAHVMAMTKRLESTWWIFQNVADYHVPGIASLVPNEWQWALEWPSLVLTSADSLQCFNLPAEDQKLHRT